MMETKGADAPITLILIHRVITRGLEACLRYTETFAREGYPDAMTGAGFALYLRMLTGALHLHHSAEDKIAFPFLRERLPDVPVDTLTVEHEEMATILEEMLPVLGRLHGEDREGPDLLTAHAALTRLSEIWPGHIDVEETSINVKRLEAVASAEELANWLQAMGQYRPEDAPPDPVALPFILYNLSVGDRTIMAQHMPPVVTQELVPVVWKEQWAPMKPFLLD